MESWLFWTARHAENCSSGRVTPKDEWRPEMSTQETEGRVENHHLAVFLIERHERRHWTHCARPWLLQACRQNGLCQVQNLIQALDGSLYSREQDWNRQISGLCLVHIDWLSPWRSGRRLHLSHWFTWELLQYKTNCLSENCSHNTYCRCSASKMRRPLFENWRAQQFTLDCIISNMLCKCLTARQMPCS